jgi:hypothetical protein
MGRKWEETGLGRSGGKK